MASGNPTQTASSLVEQIYATYQSSPDRFYEDEESRTQALHLARKLVTVLEKPKDAPFQNAFMPAQSTVVRIAVDLNLFNILAEGNGEAKSIPEIAAVTKADPELLVRILRLLDCIGYAAQVGDESYSATPVTRAMTSPALQGCITHHFDVGFPIFEKLPEYFRKFGYNSPGNADDGPFQYAFNTSLPAFKWWAQDETLSKNFNTFMTGVQGGRPNWVNWFPIQSNILDGFTGNSEDVLMVDIGGGRGHYLETFISKFPEFKGRLILEDLPAVIDDAHRLNPRIEPVKHDFFKPQPIRGARTYFMHHVLHDWPNNDVVQILRNTAAAMKPGYSKVILGEHVLPDRDCPLIKAGLDWAMMTLHCGMTRTEKQWRNLCKDAGLEVVKYWPPPGDGDGIVEAVLLEENQGSEV